MSGEYQELDLEQTTTRELVRDEDVLSLDLQRELESVGTAVGVIAAIALVASQMARASRLLFACTSPSAGVPPAPSDGAHRG